MWPPELAMLALSLISGSKIRMPSGKLAEAVGRREHGQHLPLRLRSSLEFVGFRNSLGRVLVTRPELGTGQC